MQMQAEVGSQRDVGLGGVCMGVTVQHTICMFICILLSLSLSLSPSMCVSALCVQILWQMTKFA